MNALDDLLKKLSDAHLRHELVDEAIAELAQLRARPQTTPASELDTRWQELVKAHDDERRRRQSAEAYAKMLANELRFIADADNKKFEDAAEFRAWAKSRARFALEQKP